MTENVPSPSLPDRIAEEKAEQARWRLRPQHSGMTDFEVQIENEFRAPDAQRAYESRALASFLAFAAAEVPYYRDLLASLRAAPADFKSIADLARLPELDKTIIGAQGKRLMARRLPEGQRLAGTNTSSGSTGAPTAVPHTDRSRFVHLLHAQRQLRWYRYDPMGIMAWLRMGKDMPIDNKGTPLPEGRTLKSPFWPGIGSIFETGPFLGFAKSNPMDAKVEWLDRHRPNYVLAASTQLEHIALAIQDRAPLPGIRGLRAVSEPLTPGMERRIAATFRAPVHMSYGMDEVGWVATRCTEGRRFHVHTEHCLVELVDEKSRPVAAGAQGRILVTLIGNLAMPLIRYVTDDIAIAVEGPCECGRTLPAFGPVIGRYSQMTNLPAGTLDFVAALRSAMEELPPELCRPVRQYRIHQGRDGVFALRIIAAGPLSPGLEDYVLARLRAAGVAGALWRIELTDDLPLAPSGKFFHFTSDLMAQPAAAKPAAAAPPS